MTYRSLKKMAFEPFYLAPIWIVPSDEVHVVSFLGYRPSQEGGRSQFLSGVLTPGLHFYVPWTTRLEGAYTTNSFPIFLFRHDTPTLGDYAELELKDVTLTARVTVTAQIRDPGDNIGEINRSAFWRAHYNSEGQDPLQAAERILNPYIREVLQGFVYEEYGNLEPDQIQISKIKPSELLKQLGLVQRGAYVIGNPAATPEESKTATEILAKLDNIGIAILSINIDDLALPPEVVTAKNRQAVLKAEQKAKLDEEKARALVIAQQNENLRAQARGFTDAITNATIGSRLSERDLFYYLGQYPFLKEALGDKAKVIFQGGGNHQGIAQQVLSALEGARE